MATEPRDAKTTTENFYADAETAAEFVNDDPSIIETRTGATYPSLSKIAQDAGQTTFAGLKGVRDEARQARDAAEASAAVAQSSAISALLVKGIWPTTAAGLGQGVQGTSALVAGSGGTNGTFDLAFSGGTQVIAPKGRFIVSGGTVTQVIIDYSGYYSAGTPVISFAASANLSEASVSAVMGANTPVGQYFSILSPSDDNFVDLYLNNAGVAELKDSYPSKAVYEAFLDQVRAIDTQQSAGSSDLSGLSGNKPGFANWRVPNQVFTDGGTLASVNVAMVSSGDIEVYSYTRSGNTFTPFASKVFSLNAGVQTVAVNLEVPAGGYVGIYAPDINTQNTQWTGGLHFGNAETFTAGLSTDGVAYAVTFNVETYKFVLDILTKTSDEVDRLTDFLDVVNDQKTTGSTNLDQLRNIKPFQANFRVAEALIAEGGVLTAADVAMVAAGNVTFYTYTRSGDTFTPFASKVLALSAGTQTVAVDLQIPENGYVGVTSADIDTQVVQWDGGLYYGNSETFTSALRFDGVAFAVSFHIEKDIVSLGDLNQLRSDVDLLQAKEELKIGRLTGEELLFAGGGGQSNAQGGFSGTPNITFYAKYGSQSFTNNTTTLVPAQAPDGGAEFWGYAGSAYLRELINVEYAPYRADKNNIVIFGRNAVQGTKIIDLSKGTSTYQKGLDQLTVARDYAVANSVKFVHVCNNFWQGERDAVLGTDPATYTTQAKQYAVDYDADARIIHPDNLVDKRYTLAVQSSNKINNAGDATLESGWLITQAQYAAHRESDLYHILAPMYAVDGGGNLHATSLGLAEMGAFAARSQKQILEKGYPRNALEVLDWYVDGDDMVLIYNIGGLSIEPSADYPAQTQAGFRVFNDVDTEIAATVSVSGNEVRLTPAEAPNDSFTWSYGNISATFQGGSGGGGNLYSEVDAFSPRGKMLYDRAMLQSSESLL